MRQCDRSSSALTELVKGKTLDKTSGSRTRILLIVSAGCLTENALFCYGKRGLEAAIANCRGKTFPGSARKVICKCFDVTEEDTKVAIENHLTTVVEITVIPRRAELRWH
jgi:NifU-like protein involved in Fe-S cluster formation